MNISGPQIRRLQISDADLFRDIRLEALQKNPEAFGGTFENENAQPLSWFEATLGAADIFGSFLDGALAGMAGYSARESSKQAHKGLLWTMYVRAAARNSGVGKSLVAVVLDHGAAGASKWFNWPWRARTKPRAGFIVRWALSNTVMKRRRSSTPGDITTRF